MGIVLNKNELVEIYYSFILVNETSGLEFRNFRNIEFQEINSEGIKLLVPHNICQKGHTLLVMMLKGREPRIPKKLPKTGQGKGIHFSAVGKVMEKEEPDNDRSLITIRFTQFDKHSWQDLLKSFEQRKAEIKEALASIKIKDVD